MYLSTFYVYSEFSLNMLHSLHLEEGSKASALDGTNFLIFSLLWFELFADIMGAVPVAAAKKD